LVRPVFKLGNSQFVAEPEVTSILPVNRPERGILQKFDKRFGDCALIENSLAPEIKGLSINVDPVS